MIEERALVLSVFGENHAYARVKTQRQSACNACELKASCGQNLISRLASGHGVEMEVDNRLLAREGDVVVLAIPEQGLMKASMVMFLIPILAMALFALFSQVVLGLSDPWVALSSLVGLALGFVLVRVMSARFQGQAEFQPVMHAIALSADFQGVCKR